MCSVLGRLLAMLRMSIIVCRFCFCPIYVIALRTNFTMLTISSRCYCHKLWIDDVLFHDRSTLAIIIMPLIPMHSPNQGWWVAMPSHYCYCTHTAVVLLTSQGLEGCSAAPKAPPLKPPLAPVLTEHTIALLVLLQQSNNDCFKNRTPAWCSSALYVCPMCKCRREVQQIYVIIAVKLIL